MAEEHKSRLERQSTRTKKKTQGMNKSLALKVAGDFASFEHKLPILPA